MPAATPPAFIKLRQLLLEGRVYTIPKGQVLQSSEHRQVINYIQEGYIKRYHITSSGRLDVQAIYGADDIFPLTLAFKVLLDQELYEGPEVYYYETITPVKLYAADPGLIKSQTEVDPSLYRDLFVAAGKRFHSNIQLLENLSLGSAYSRTAHQLLYFARVFGKKKKAGIEIDVPLTHQDLADILSLSRETVSVSITSLSKKGLIRGGKKTVVLDMPKLEKEAYS